jgi:hypothetical protein
MGIHQQINHKTVDAQALPMHDEGHEVMYAISKMLWNLDNSEEYTTFHDYWSNSTPTKGVRTLRVRHMYNHKVNAVIPAIHEMLAQFKGQYKVWFYTNTWMLGDIGYDVHSGRALCVTLYYRSRPTKEYEYKNR